MSQVSLLYTSCPELNFGGAAAKHGCCFVKSMQVNNMKNGLKNGSKQLTTKEDHDLYQLEMMELIPLLRKERTNLSRIQKLAYGVGHVLNDILGSIWFSYTLIFLQLVAEMKPTIAALLMFIGQTADALATPFLGALIDKCGSKKKWHLFGIIMVAFSFPFIMQTCWKDHPLAILYYTLAIVVFQVGWAVVQLSHLSLIPELTTLTKVRASLTSLRYSSSVCSNIIVYASAYFILRTNQNDTQDTILGPDDVPKFQVLVATATFIGLSCSVFFHCVLKVKPKKRWYEIDAADQLSSDMISLMSDKKSNRPFYLCGKLYLIASIHTTSRLFYTMGLVYFPFYINETAITDPSAVAVAPFLCFLASLAASVGCSYLPPFFTNKMIFGIGSFFSLLGCWCAYLNPDHLDVTHFVYLSSICYGIGSSLNITSSLCIAANFIGVNTDTGASVYSLITFCDKILSGICIMLIEYMKCSIPMFCNHYYKFILTDVTGISVIIGSILILALPAKLSRNSG